MQKIAARILVVDDNPDVLTAARVELRQKFETVITEQYLSKLDSIFKQTSFDVILLNMNFAAGVNSVNEVLFWLKKICSARSGQKEVLITAYSDIQLAHAVERAVIMSDHSNLLKDDFVFANRPVANVSKNLSIDELERHAIIQSIDLNDGNMSKVAKELDLGRTTLYRKMEKYGIVKQA